VGGGGGERGGGGGGGGVCVRIYKRVQRYVTFN